MATSGQMFALEKFWRSHDSRLTKMTRVPKLLDKTLSYQVKEAQILQGYSNENYKALIAEYMSGRTLHQSLWEVEEEFGVLIICII